MLAFLSIVKWDYKICLMNKLYYHFIVVYVKKAMEKYSHLIVLNIHILFSNSGLRDCISSCFSV